MNKNNKTKNNARSGSRLKADFFTGYVTLVYHMVPGPELSGLLTQQILRDKGPLNFTGGRRWHSHTGSLIATLDTVKTCDVRDMHIPPDDSGTLPV